MNKVFVTGASGFIGTNLIHKLSKMDCTVYALYREMPPRNTKNEKIILLKGDILDIQSLNSYFGDVDTIFNCVAYISFQKRDFQKAHRINVEGTRSVLESAYKAKVRKVVHLSACAVLGYSKNDKEIIDESSNPIIKEDNVYAYTKKIAEEEVQKYVQKGLDVSIANLATVYGPGDKKMNSGAIIKAIYENKIKFAPPGGTSYLTIDDLIDGLILLAEKGRPGERYIFCNENLTFLELFNRIAKILGCNKIKFKIPRWTYPLAIATAYILDRAIKYNEKQINLITPQIIRESYNYKYYSSQKAKVELGWKPKRSLEEIVGEAFEYYKKEGLISNG